MSFNLSSSKLAIRVSLSKVLVISLIMRALFMADTSGTLAASCISTYSKFFAARPVGDSWILKWSSS
jgi:hypothetical protein